MTTAQWALFYAQQFDWAVFPVHSIVNGACTCSKGASCPHRGKHPATKSGFKDASKDPAVIKSMFAQAGYANVGVATGLTSKIFVVDVDPRNGGWESLEELETGRELGALPFTMTARTGGGGRHYFFKMPPGGVPSVPNWLPGVDVKSDGGYVVLAPSNHASGLLYAWYDLASDTETHSPSLPPCAAPDDVVAMIRGAKSAKKAAKDAAGGGSAPADIEAWLASGPLPEGGRNNALYQMACKVHRLKRDALYTNLVIRTKGTESGIGQAELDVLIGSAVAFVDKEVAADVAQISSWLPSDADGTVGTGAAAPHGKKIDGDGDHELAMRFVAAFGADVRFVPAWGWLMWNGRIWRPCTGKHGNLEIVELARSMSSQILAEAAATADTDRQGQLIVLAKQAKSLAKINAMVTLAQGDPQVLRTVADFNAAKDLLPCANGVVNLRTGKLRPHSRDDHFTFMANVDYDPGVADARWNAFVGETVGGDVEYASYLRRAAGYTITGETSEEKFFVVYGPPASGKSTFMDVLQTLLGSLSTTLAAEHLAGRASMEAIPPHELAKLVGKRMVGVSELSESQRLNESAVKRLTGRDRISGAEKFKGPFDFVPDAKFWVTTNHLPRIQDDGIWRRLEPLPFVHPPKVLDPSLKTWLKDPDGGLRAVLRWVVDGSVDWYANGLGGAVVVNAARDEYRSNEDRYGQYLQECCAVAEGVSVGAVELYQSYAFWSEQRGEKPMTMTAFGRKLGEDPRFGRDETSARKKRWVGLTVVPNVVGSGAGWIGLQTSVNN